MYHVCYGFARFGFDLIYGGDSEQVSLWNDVGVPALEKAFAGQWGWALSYCPCEDASWGILCEELDSYIKV